MSDLADRWREVLDAVRRHRLEPLPDGDRSQLLQLAMDTGRRTVPGVISCSVTHRSGPGPFATVAMAGEIATALDEVQYRTLEGPCVTAALTGDRQRVDTMADDARWPGFSRAATGLGVHASLSLPIRRPGHEAALNLYGAAPQAFRDPRPQLLADLVAGVVASVVAPGPVTPPGVAEDDGVAEARREGALIRRAQHALAERRQVAPADAYRELAVRSAHEGRRLVDIAQDELDRDGPSGRTGRTGAAPDDELAQGGGQA